MMPVTEQPAWFKRFLFHHYGWIALLGFVAAIAAVMTLPDSTRWQVAGALVAGSVTLVYTVLKQSLDEMRAFIELFAKFNERYDKMNEPMNSLRQRGEPITDQSDFDTLYNYFNLCGEEYLLYQEGYVHPHAWEAWRGGMRVFCQNPHIREIWKRELETGSYYGLTLAEIERAPG